MGKYTLFYNTAQIEYTGNDEVEIGKIVDTETKEDIMYVYYSKNLYQTEGYHTCIGIYKDKNGEYPVAKVDDLHRDCLFAQPNVFLCMMLHEYGHYLNGDLNVTGLTDQKIRDERMRCIMEGRVMEMEAKADAFAISHVGKNTFMRSMDYMIKKRRERGDEAIHMAIREFELRKKAARNLR